MKLSYRDGQNGSYLDQVQERKDESVNSSHEGFRITQEAFMAFLFQIWTNQERKFYHEKNLYSV